MIRSARGRIGVVLLAALLAVLAAWYVRDTQRALDGNERAIAGNEQALKRLGVEVRADCAFKRDVADLPRRLPASAGPVTYSLAWDAYDAYVTKGCEAELGPLAPPPAPRPPTERG